MDGRKKIIVIGCPGSGKSVFSRALHEITGIPLFHLDRMYWNPDRTKADQAVFQKRLSDTIQKNEWILDGNYNASIEIRLQACDTVFFLDYPLHICLHGVRERRGKARSDMPWTEQEGEEDAAFIAFIKNYHSQSRPKVMDLLDTYSHKNIHIFKNRTQAEAFLTHTIPLFRR